MPIIDLPVTPVAAAVQQVAREKGRTVMITASAISEFTSKNCSPTSSHWADDTHALTTGVAKLMTGPTSHTWFFITVDFSFGEALEALTAKAIEANGGKVIGDVKFPIGNSEFSSQIVAAQSSGASIVGIAAVGGDQVNLIKQAAEFGLRKNGVQLAGYLVYITDIHALGLDVAQGLSFPAGFYWDQNDESPRVRETIHGGAEGGADEEPGGELRVYVAFPESDGAGGNRRSDRGQQGDAGDAGGVFRTPRHAAGRWTAAVRRDAVSGETTG